MYPWLPAMLQATGSDAPDTVLADTALRLLDIGMAMGLPRAQMLDVPGMEDTMVRNPMARLPLASILKLADAIETRSGNVMAGLQIAGQLSPRSFSDIGYPILYAPNVATALQLFCEIQPFYQNVLRSSFCIEEPQEARLSFELPNTDPDQAAPLSEWVLVAHINVGTTVAGRALPIREVGFAHAPRRAAALYEEHFGCPVKFKQPQSYVLLDKDRVSQTAPRQNPHVIQAALAAHDMLEQWQSAGKLTLIKAYLFCLLQLDRRPISLARMAAAFGQSERTLRRMLIEDGLPFREVFDIARRVHFKLYNVEGLLSLGQIAQKLGYGELSALSRAQRRWKAKS
jgi:AraC-like DNA-binding protein